MTPVLQVDRYTLDYATRAGAVHVLDDVSLTIAKGEVLGLVGESGSGKTSLAWAITRALPGNAHEAQGTICLCGEDLREVSTTRLTAIRGRHIGMVFQDPSTSLNPTLTLGRQVGEVLQRHRGMTRAQAEQETIALLRHVELRDPEALLHRYPHEVSGGEKQRVVIATAFACRPELIIFDEPTTALDVITGARILELFQRLRAETHVAALYISHDLALVSRVADRVAVLERGRIVEEAPAADMFRAPTHPYTRRLVQAVPRPDRRLVFDTPQETTVLSGRGLGVRYGRARLFGRTQVTGASGISLDVHAGEILGVVGESGSGKSTLARALTGLAPFQGEITFRGRTIVAPRAMDRAYRSAVQIVFQHPDSSLNPRHRIGETLSRPLRLFGARDKVVDLLEQVRLPASCADRYPHQLSGGEKQRVAIARAFAARPALVICDEITAALDVSVQAAVIELLLALRQQHGTAYLFITHDINLVRQIAHRLAVMRQGALVDLLPIEALSGPDTHPYTRALLAASPTPVGLEGIT
jgi:peptide/nickel transport system ATP-binding protein